jgi:hypothetical protein
VTAVSRVIGVLASTGQGLGMNTDELVIVPVALAQAMFNSNTLFRILVEATSRDAIEPAKAQVAEIIRLRHEGEEDVTIITQDAVLATFDRLLGTMTLAVAGIAAISLAVAGILVMNVMLVSVTSGQLRSACSRRSARPAPPSATPFSTEAAMLSMAGAALGFVLGQAGAALIRQIYPVFRPLRQTGRCSQDSGRRSPPASSSASCRRDGRPGSTPCSRSPDAESATGDDPPTRFDPARLARDHCAPAAQLSDPARHRRRHCRGDPADLDRRGHPPLRPRRVHPVRHQRDQRRAGQDQHLGPLADRHSNLGPPA